MLVVVVLVANMKLHVDSIQDIPESLHDSSHLYFVIDPKQTNYVNRIIEGYEYLGVMTTLNRDTGLTMIRSTADTKELAKALLESLALDHLEFVDLH